jgi:hypothetical protein
MPRANPPPNAKPIFGGAGMEASAVGSGEERVNPRKKSKKPPCRLDPFICPSHLTLADRPLRRRPVVE